MSESPINGDTKVILTHINYIREDIKTVQKLLEKDNARLSDLETGRAVMIETINGMKKQANVFSAVVSGLAAFLATVAAFLMRKI